MQLTVTAPDGTDLPAVLTMPPDGVRARGGLVTLHPSGVGRHDYFLFRHLAELLPRYGVAVLCYDRRTVPDGGDVPYQWQARDALAARRALADRLPPRAPVGLWGFSQGAWAALLAAASCRDVRFLVLVAACGVTPAAQMRYAAAEHLRRAGHPPDVIATVDGLRREVEAYLRGERDRTAIQRMLDGYAGEPWFDLAFLRTPVPEPGTWDDMDFDPVPVFGEVPCPVLAFYGQADEWIPIEASIAAWHQAVRHGALDDVTLVRLCDTGHAPVTGGGDGSVPGPVSDDYVRRLLDWLDDRLP